MEIQELEINQDFQITHDAHTDEDIYFDQVVDLLQEIVFNSKFDSTRKQFLKKHCNIFNSKVQHKAECAQIFDKYLKQVQLVLENNIQQRMKTFKMEKFLKLLKSRNNQIDQQILDLFNSFTNFECFKNMMVEFKAEYTNKSTHQQKQNNQLNQIMSIKPMRKKPN